MSYYKLEIAERKDTGSSSARALRRAGRIPAVYYFTGQDNVNLEIDHRVLIHALHSGQRIFEITLNAETQYAMIKDVQYHPVTDEVLHLDLLRVRRSEKITISIPLVLEGAALGVREGGVLTQNLTSLEIRSLPTDVPGKVAVDVSGLELNATLLVSQISLPEGIEMVTAGDLTVATISTPAVEVEPVVEVVPLPEEEAAPPEEAAAPPAEEREGKPPAEGTPEKSGEEG